MASLFQTDLAAGSLVDLIDVHGETVAVYDANGAPVREIAAIVERHGAKSDHAAGTGRQKNKVERVRVIASTALTTGLGNPGPGQSVRLAGDGPNERWAWSDTERRNTAAVVAVYTKISRQEAGERAPK